ncbi:cytochrome b5 [Hymenobacter roseosalivarius DSM 11622]|uniref:Cytochrome b5 n=1 Tax=Hymenobacter roseosalivarius DSM 11622 TaxID=645990 RepID=A0A1W1V0G3_9BACT|nr:cytochrome b5 domain-containing protein [Hymenobacter roseosalivarius]SMB86786.1 cytochrome b5 [Hymenobacter roseosalivarius DSM 11622]
MDNAFSSEKKSEKPTTKNDLPEYTLSQLALRNGQDRDEIWVSYQGLIYDVGRSRLWTRGNHYGHWAGQDLTAELHRDAPHTAHVFDKFTVIGKLKLPPGPGAPNQTAPQP